MGSTDGTGCPQHSPVVSESIFFYLKKDLFYFMCVSVLPTCMYVCPPCVYPVPEEAREGIGASRSVVTDGWKLQMVGSSHLSAGIVPTPVLWKSNRFS